jgi:hypothetical protein
MNYNTMVRHGITCLPRMARCRPAVSFRRRRLFPCHSYFDTHRHGECAASYRRTPERLDKVVELKAQTDADLIAWFQPRSTLGVENLPIDTAPFQRHDTQ